MVLSFAVLSFVGLLVPCLLCFCRILKATFDLSIWWSVQWMSIFSRHLVMMKSIICQCLERACIHVVLRSSFCLNMVFVTISSNWEPRANRSSPLELHFPIPCLLMTKGHLFLSGFVIVGAYTLIIEAKLSLLKSSLIVKILSLTGRGISFSFVTISFLIARPTPASLLCPSGLPLQKKEYSKSLRLPDSENLVSHRAAMSMLYLASSIATSVVRLSGRSAPSRSRRVLTFHCAIVSSCLALLLPTWFSTVDGRWGRAAQSLVTRATADSVW